MAFRSDHSTMKATALALAALVVIAGCDTNASPDYAARVLAIEKTTFDERGMPSLTFTVENTGPSRCTTSACSSRRSPGSRPRSASTTRPS